MEIPFRLLADIGPGATWAAIFLAAIVAVFVFYIGVAMLATLRAHDPEQIKIRYRIFSDLLALFCRRRRH
jgi:hypothetical protein